MPMHSHLARPADETELEHPQETLAVLAYSGDVKLSLLEVMAAEINGHGVCRVSSGESTGE